MAATMRFKPGCCCGGGQICAYAINPVPLSLLLSISGMVPGAGSPAPAACTLLNAVANLELPFQGADDDFGPGCYYESLDLFAWSFWAWIYEHLDGSNCLRDYHVRALSANMACGAVEWQLLDQPCTAWDLVDVTLLFSLGTCCVDGTARLVAGD